MDKNIKNQFADSFADKKSIKVPISKLKENERHTFKIRDDAEMKMLVESISEYGLLNPIVIRPALRMERCTLVLTLSRQSRKWMD